jgi:hypothetical protein
MATIMVPKLILWHNQGIWACAVMAVCATISMTLIKRPAELWQLACTMDVVALICGLICLIVLGLSIAWQIIYVLPTLLSLLSSCAFAITGHRTYLQHRESLIPEGSKDPLKPYLM